MHVAVVGRLHTVVCGLEVVARSEFKVKHTVAECQSRRVVDAERAAAVDLAVVVALGGTVAGEQMRREVPRLACAEGEAHHVHGHGAPHATDVGVAGGASAGGGVQSRWSR